MFEGGSVERLRKSSLSSKGVGLFPTVTIHAILKFPLTTRRGWKMALSNDEAIFFAQKILEKMAESGSLQTLGPVSGMDGEEGNIRRGKYDAAYLSVLYRELVNELQK
ncbi:hypothetical protein PAEH1_02800 [Paenalcaligenes hominis]|uniref:Uncharacterized protein n=1 Tax=Paenalcaligenes hominis TaxID=643674 RepID=A0A1U9JYA2_9BURK|nr:hypothetical protein [Paenalcaligenes hominis]AQS50752.1 hypothetical protein PAEH1_02800 [Paenalcaligenes hominis]